MSPGPSRATRAPSPANNTPRSARLASPGPYILVGASLGGPYVTVVADMFRDETAALVLLDSVHPDQLNRLPPPSQRALAALRVANRVLPMLAALGLTHLVDLTGVLLGGLPSKHPADAASQLRTFAHWPGYWSAVYDEVSVWDDTMEQMRRAMDHGALQELPLVVLTGPDNPGMEAMEEPWLDMQRDLARASTAVTHHVVQGAGHIAMATEPEPIQKLINAVRALVDSN